MKLNKAIDSRKPLMNKITILCNEENREAIFRRKTIINPITDSFGGIKFRIKGKLYLVFNRYIFTAALKL